MFDLSLIFMSPYLVIPQNDDFANPKTDISGTDNPIGISDKSEIGDRIVFNFTITLVICPDIAHKCQTQ